jgi:hypothetical protein
MFKKQEKRPPEILFTPVTPPQKGRMGRILPHHLDKFIFY